MKIRNSQGFTLFEVLLAVIIISAASIGLMQGVAYVKAEIISIRLKERALDELVGFTDYWKARVAAYQIPTFAPQGFNQEVILVDNPGTDRDIVATLTVTRIAAEHYPAHSLGKYYGFKTKIEWLDPRVSKKNKQRIVFNVKQLVFLQ